MKKLHTLTAVAIIVPLLWLPALAQDNPNCPNLPQRLVVGQRGQSIRDGMGATNARPEPGVGEPLFLIQEGESFDVIGGPVCGIARNGNRMRYFQIENNEGQQAWIPEANQDRYFMEPVPMEAAPDVQSSGERPLLQYGDTYQGQIYRMVDVVGTREGCDFLRFTGTQGDTISVSMERLTEGLLPTIYFQDITTGTARFLGDLQDLPPVQNYTLTLENTGWYWFVICVPNTGVVESGEYRLTLGEASDLSGESQLYGCWESAVEEARYCFNSDGSFQYTSSDLNQTGSFEITSEISVVIRIGGQQSSDLYNTYSFWFEGDVLNLQRQMSTIRSVITLTRVDQPVAAQPSYVVRTLDRSEYQIDLIFDPEGCLLVNGHDLIVREIQQELDILNAKSSNEDVYAEIFLYLAPVVGDVEGLRGQVEDIMVDINPRCASDYFYYRVGDNQRGIRFVDPSGLGNIAYGYFSTLFTAPQWTQDVVADIDQRFNPDTWLDAFIRCGFDANCATLAITVVGDNPDDRRQRLVGEQMAGSGLPLTVDLFIRYSNTYNLY